MKIVAYAILNKQEGEFQNYTNGSQELEVNLSDINFISDNKTSRHIGINKDLYKLTTKSYTKVKQELQKANLMWRLSLEKDA